jgi:hypothetical protein
MAADDELCENQQRRRSIPPARARRARPAFWACAVGESIDPISRGGSFKYSRFRGDGRSISRSG